MERLEDEKQRIWYVEQSLENGWLSNILDMQIGMKSLIFSLYKLFFS